MVFVKLDWMITIDGWLWQIQTVGKQMCLARLEQKQKHTMLLCGESKGVASFEHKHYVCYVTAPIRHLLERINLHLTTY